MGKTIKKLTTTPENKKDENEVSNDGHGVDYRGGLGYSIACITDK